MGKIIIFFCFPHFLEKHPFLFPPKTSGYPRLVDMNVSWQTNTPIVRDVFLTESVMWEILIRGFYIFVIWTLSQILVRFFDILSTPPSSSVVSDVMGVELFFLEGTTSTSGVHENRNPDKKILTGCLVGSLGHSQWKLFLYYESMKSGGFPLWCKVGENDIRFLFC